MLAEPTDFCRLIFLRHPELDPGSANLAVGGGDAPLGRRGQAQVLQWLERFADLKIDTVYTSPQAQCVDPARALAASKQIELQVDPRLADQQMGAWQGRAWDDLVKEEGAAVHEFFAQFGEATAPNGETLGAAIERVLSWWKDTAQDGLQKTLAVVASGAMISGFATAMLGMRLSRSVSLNLPHAGIGVMDCFANGVRITSWNPTALTDL